MSPTPIKNGINRLDWDQSKFHPTIESVEKNVLVAIISHGKHEKPCQHNITNNGKQNNFPKRGLVSVTFSNLEKS